MPCCGAAADHQLCINRSISPGCWAHSSKPVAVACGDQMRQTDRQTPDSYTDPAPHTMQVVPTNWMRVIATSPSGDIRRYWDKIFEEFKSSKQHDNGTNWLARYDFLIVFYSDCRTTLNCCCTRYVMCLIPQPSGFGSSPVLTPGESVWVHATVSNLRCRPSVESLWVRMQNCKRLMTK